MEAKSKKRTLQNHAAPKVALMRELLTQPAATMSSVRSSMQSLMQMFSERKEEFVCDINNVHMVWLGEIHQEANHMFSRDFNTEPELMPKTPSQKKNSRRKRVSVGRQEEGQAKRRFSKGRRSNVGSSSVKSLNFIAEEEASVGQRSPRPQRTTRRNKQTKVEEDVSQPPRSCDSVEECNKKPELVEDKGVDINSDVKPDEPCDTSKIPSPNVVVIIPASERLSAEHEKQPQSSPGRTAAKIAIAGNSRSSRRSSVRCSLKLRHSLAGLRHSMTQESLRRSSRRSMMKRKEARMGNSSCSSNVDDVSNESVEETAEVASEVVRAEPEVIVADSLKLSPQAHMQSTQSAQPFQVRVTRSVAANSSKLAPPSLFATPDRSTPVKKTVVTDGQQTSLRLSQSIKRKAPDTVDEGPKRSSPPKKSHSAVRPNMRSFLHTVQKNQRLVMTPNSFSRTTVMKSFIKHNTPLKIDPKLSTPIVAKERQKLEALKKKQEQEEERMRKMEEEKKKKQEEYKRKRDERLRKVFEAKVKEELREEEKKKKVEQKMANIDEKNDKRQAEERAKKRIAVKRLEELEQKRKLEEETRRKKIQQAEEEKRQQELLAKKAKEEELKARKLAEARRALELKREQELERERQAAAERERAEREKALALQRELERAARENEMRELEEKRKALEEKRIQEEQKRLAAEEKAAKEREAAAAAAAAAAAQQAANAQTAAALNVTVDIEHSVRTTPTGKGGSLNVTVDIEKSPQSYSITPKGGNTTMTLSKNTEDYGMDQNSDDSTDDESAPRKPIPSWAEGHNLQQIIMKQYYNPPDLDSFFGTIEAPKLENIFYKSKPRYFKRTSSAVWHSPPVGKK
ncbi:inner centromere protein A-like isoform X2 [Dunckerocampus dactyliophorus]|uniref:inner centromere protein A-like isoform X2 n=1 Tax=Dunckerocampus dactyliophorus TaxID=161453 RepID=UPI0024073AF4|nr:inner centromere protein A-like isoform X2 [Dunckerocampus dactyliophorus]